jgi:hypothetical protein
VDWSPGCSACHCCPCGASCGWPSRSSSTPAGEQYYDPARIRAQLEQVDEARRTGELFEEERVEIENELLQR